MLTRDVSFEGWTVQDWSRVLGLFQPVRDPSRAPAPSLGGLIVLHDGARIAKLLHTRTGRLDPTRDAWPSDLAGLSSRHEASWALAAHRSALPEIMERFGAGARREDDILDQSLALTLIVRDLMREGAIAYWPHRLEGLRVPSAELVRNAIDAVCRDGEVMLLGVFDGGELWTSIALQWSGSCIDRIVGPEEARRAMGLVSGDWQRDYIHLAHAVEQRIGKLALGFFCERDTLRALEVDPRPGAWARAVALREVIVEPLPGPLTIPLAVDAARGTLKLARSAIRRFDPLGVLAPILKTWPPPSVEGAAPFAPLDLLRKLLER